MLSCGKSLAQSYINIPIAAIFELIRLIRLTPYTQMETNSSEVCQQNFDTWVYLLLHRDYQ